ncbi:MAG TPA: fumarylacetoacetase [Acetobacteraceae bacterium]|nr:fumarylacetoacetase [Acetobacteraceae bacterium]
MTDPTLDPALRSWVSSAQGHRDFPIQNLPLGVFSPAGGGPRGGVAIGDAILDLGAAAEVLSGEAAAAALAATGASLNALLAMGAGPRLALRAGVSALLAAGAAARSELLHTAADCALHLPAVVGDYTDFFAGIHHATNTGRQFRPDNPLLPNYRYVPVAYHGRASSVRASGAAVRRPNGQRKPAPETVPAFGPSRNLDFELELGVWIGPGNAPGEPIPIARAAGHIAGFCLLNDWSARDIQAWEYQPLGPFLAKNFCTTVSPWIVTPEALAPFRVARAARGADEPAPLPYLDDAADAASGGLDLVLDVSLQSAAMRAAGQAPARLSRSNARHLYWTVAQMVAHHASGGCDLRPGDLFGSGTISAPDPDGYGSLLEITNGGRAPVTLPSGETRRFLEDGDEIVLRARAERDGFVPIGFGECRGRVEAAPG